MMDSDTGGAPAVLFAPAKLTLSLRITGVRADGYHFIDAEMTTLDLGDSLEVTPGGSDITMLPSGADCDADAVSFADGRIVSDDNLVTKALELAKRKAGVTVRKRIPLGAGLGGGSADAAAVLRWAGITDLERSVGIGADVAFCLVGGRARVRGIGEVVEPEPYICERYTLLIPPLSCSTPAVYAAWDEMGGPVGSNGNDLEAAALRVAPELSRWRDRLGDTTGLTPRLAGSGSTWFVSGAHHAPGFAVVTTRPPEQGPYAGPVTCDVGAVCSGASSGTSSSACACGAS